MIGAIIGAALNAGSAIAGNIMSSRANRKAQAAQEAAYDRQEAYWTRRANEDPLQRTAAQAMITRTADELKKVNRAAQGRQAVMGGTEASVAATKDASARALGETVRDAAILGEEARERAEENLIGVQTDRELSRAGWEAARAQNVANAMSQAGEAAGSIAGSIDGGGLGTKTAGSGTGGTGGGTETGTATGGGGDAKYSVRNGRNKA